MYGTGQGSGNSPTYWLFISSTLFDIYDQTATGSTYTSYNNDYSIILKAIGIVDNVRNTTNTFYNNTSNLTTLTALAQSNAQLWHDILSTTNQALELSKCGYHSITYAFNHHGRPNIIAKPKCDIIINDTQGFPLPIQQCPNFMATKYLGVQKCPAHQMKQYTVLKVKCNHFAKVIQPSHLTRCETQVFYWSIYQLSVNYVLPSTYFTFKELSKVQSLSHSAMPTQTGYCRTTPREVVYASPRLGGAGLFHLYDEQGFGQVKMFLKMWRSPDTQTGQLL